MRVARRLVAAVAVSVLAAACSPQELGDTVDELVSPPAQEVPADGGAPANPAAPAPDAPAEDQPPPDAPTGGDGSGDGAAPAGPSGGGDTGGGEGGGGGEQPPADAPAPQLTTLRDGGPVGTNGAAYLRGDRPRVVLEVDVQDGASMPGAVLDHVRSVLDRESNASVEVVTASADVPRRDAWTVDQLAAAAASTRDVAHGDDVAVLHLLVLRDGFEDGGVLGLAFDSSTAVVFPDQWSSLTTLLLSGDRIARAVTTHEVGHLLGLVGLGEEPVQDHEDPEHPGHTTDRDDVMFWAVETDLIGSLDGVPIDFGPLTRADLAALREG